MVDINNKHVLFSSIDKFKEGAKPLFGILTPQHVVEHLITSLRLSTGKKEIEFTGNQEIADKIKAVLIYSDAEMPQNIKNPLLTDGLAALLYKNLEESKEQLKEELVYFYAYKAQNPMATGIHPRMNVLSMEEWSVIHGKHFAHHFKQYGLL